MKVYFEKVGDSNANFVRECKGDLTYEWLCRQIKAHYMSRNIITLSYDEETNVGIIFGGFQTIGGFGIEK